jgi:hypothetical protein
MGIISSSNHPKLHWPGVKAIWGQVYNEHQKEYPDLFDIDTSTKGWEEDVKITAHPLAPIQGEGESVSYASDSQSYVTRYTHVGYGLGFIVTRIELADNQYPIVAKRRAKANAFSMRQTKEVVSANVYNRAFSSNYPGGDGVAILSDSHPDDQGGTWSNILATPADLSEVALEDLLTQIMTSEDGLGNKINIMPMSLHIHPSNWWEANRILKSVLQSNSAENNINVLKATNALPKGIKMNHYFTDTDAWFVRTNIQNGMIMYNRENFPLKKDNDFATDNCLAKSYMRFSVGNTDPLGLFGSAGA